MRETRRGVSRSAQAQPASAPWRQGQGHEVTAAEAAAAAGEEEGEEELLVGRLTQETSKSRLVVARAAPDSTASVTTSLRAQLRDESNCFFFEFFF